MFPTEIIYLIAQSMRGYDAWSLLNTSKLTCNFIPTYKDDFASFNIYKIGKNKHTRRTLLFYGHAEAMDIYDDYSIIGAYKGGHLDLIVKHKETSGGYVANGLDKAICNNRVEIFKLIVNEGLYHDRMLHIACLHGCCEIIDMIVDLKGTPHPLVNVYCNERAKNYIMEKYGITTRLAYPCLKEKKSIDEILNSLSFNYRRSTILEKRILRTYNLDALSKYFVLARLSDKFVEDILSCKNMGMFNIIKDAKYLNIDHICTYGTAEMIKEINISNLDRKEMMMVGASINDISLINKSINLGCKNWNAALCYASTHGHLDMVKYLIDRGANDYESCYFSAAKNNKFNIIDYLIDEHRKHVREDISCSLGNRQAVEYVMGKTRIRKVNKCVCGHLRSSITR